MARVYRRRVARGGYVLVLLAFLLIGILGLAALLIDVGLVRLTREQMQTATRNAALEGLRFRDQLPPGWEPSLNADPEFVAACGAGSAADPDWRDCVRRWLASQNVVQHFDSDFDPQSSDTVSLGAGPVMSVTGGIGPAELAASALIEVTADRAYRPQQASGAPGLELNLENAPAGDLVAGTWLDGVQPIEDSSYVRSDFQPQEGNDSASFLERMRRTSDVGGLDRLPGISTSGPTLPLLFGRGTLVQTGPQNSGSRLRLQGFVVRSVSIATARPALSVGPALPNATPPVPGALPIMVHESAWKEFWTSGSLATSPVEFQGSISLGKLLTESSSLDSLPENLEFGYVPIVADRDESLRGRVIGFGFVSRGPSGWQPEANRVAPLNASVVLTTSLSSSFGTDTLDSELLERFWQAHRSLPNPLLAPALTR